MGVDELIIKLAELYERHGLRRYKPGCFEDYSLYLDNIDFLISKNVIAFGGAEGRLLALRPDVTLSVVSHLPDDKNTRKLYYAEKVYRRSEGGEFKELDQTGVEFVGDIDRACESEIMWLICDTLSLIGGRYILDVSHMGYIEGYMRALGADNAQSRVVYELLREKNAHDFVGFSRANGLDRGAAEIFERIINIGGNMADAVAEAKRYALNDDMERAADELECLTRLLAGWEFCNNVRLNFSIANSADYYNGIIFNGYVDGVPKRVLSGGRYDKLLKKYSKSGGAIGFALYLGELERYFKTGAGVADSLILYGADTQREALLRAREIIAGGGSVRLASEVPEDIKFKSVTDLRKFK